MKRIVKGKLYDTEEATVVCSWNETGMLFGIELEAIFTLYREKVSGNPSEGLKLEAWGGVSDWDVKKDPSKGEFFFAVAVNGTYGKGSIRPVCVDEAKRIFEEHTDAEYCLEDDYEKYFGVRPQKPLLEQLKEAFKAGAAAKQKQYEEEKAKAAGSKEQPF